MKNSAGLKVLLTISSVSLLSMSCATDLPELPVESSSVLISRPASLSQRQYSLQKATPEQSPSESLEEPNQVALSAVTGQASPPHYEVVDLSSIQVAPVSYDIDRVLRIIADDLVAGLGFISSMSPGMIIISPPSTSSQFDQLVTSAIARRGYIVNDPEDHTEGLRLATSILISDHNPNLREVTGLISIHGVLFKRSYSVNHNSVKANGTYHISGINPLLVRRSERVRVI